MLPIRQQLSNTPVRFPEDLELRQTDWPHRHAPLVPAPLQDLHSPRSDPRRASEASRHEQAKPEHRTASPSILPDTSQLSFRAILGGTNKQKVVRHRKYGSDVK